MIWNRNDLKNLPTKSSVIYAGDDRMETYSEDTMMHGSPDAVLIARDEKEILEVLAFCHARKIPVTFCGSQTSMSGSSVPLEGLLVSTEKMEGVLDIYKEGGNTLVDVRPGTVVADFQKAVADAGFFYPVAPTSRDECRIGSNVVTNATGEDSYKYGPARVYVKRLELYLPGGVKRVLSREEGETPVWERNRGGYFVNWKNPIDLIIGSEGTLGFVAKATFGLLPKSPQFFSALIPLSSNWDALNFVMEIATKNKMLAPRALEFVDTNALKVMSTADGFPKLPERTGALLYIKQEYSDDAKKDEMLSKWYEASVPFAGQELADAILIAETIKQQEEFRLWRHHIPETENENGRKYWAEGGVKIGSDWWVPISRLPEMMAHFYKVADATGLPYIAYAHIGAGHPHTNLHGRNAKEKEIAKEALRNCCRKAVELGGGVSGEHGIGKIYRDLVAIQHPQPAIEQMRSWKLEYDPNWILGRGNIFE